VGLSSSAMGVGLHDAPNSVQFRPPAPSTEADSPEIRRGREPV
jgi:hypothetical protein